MMVVLISMSAMVVLPDQADAAIEGNYGEITEIDLAPGFSYIWSTGYPSDLEVTTTILECEDGIIAEVISGDTVKVTVKDGVVSGSYDLVVKAETNTGNLYQDAYKHLRYNIVSGLTVSPDQIINDIIIGSAIVDFTPEGSSDMGEVTWEVNGELPAGLSWDGSKVTGTPTTVGQQTVSLTASARGQTQELTITFTVYNVILDNGDEVIFSNGSPVSSAAIIQTGDDLAVTWAVTSGNLPVGFSLDPSTGIISGASTTLQEVVVTITGTSANGPTQSVTKDITIRSEPTLSVSSASNEIIVFQGGSNKTMEMTATAGTSNITWTVTSASGISIDSSGLLTVTPEASTKVVTVTATTAYGGVATKDVNVIKEDAAFISGSDSLTAKTGTAATGPYSCNVEGVWSVDLKDVPVGVTVELDDLGVLSLSGSAPTETFDVTITLTTAGGQTVSKTVSCLIVSKLVFTTEPSNGLIILEA